MNVAIIGCGVRGSVAAAVLAGAGVTELSLVDQAIVDAQEIGLHPLQFTPDVGAGKADSLVAKLGLINPATHAQPFPANLDEANAVAILTGADVVIDCADDPATTAAIEIAADELGIALVSQPSGYSRDEVTPAQAVSVGALQADQALRALQAATDEPDT